VVGQNLPQSALTVHTDPAVSHHHKWVVQDQRLLDRVPDKHEEISIEANGIG